MMQTERVKYKFAWPVLWPRTLGFLRDMQLNYR